MFKSKVFKLALVVFILLLGAGVIASKKIAGQTEVVVAKTKITAGQEIKVTDLEVKSIDNKLVPDGAISNVDEIKNKVATTERLQGDVITNKVVNDNQTLNLSNSEGLIAIPINGVEAKYLLPGAKVSVVIWKSDSQSDTIEGLKVLNTAQTVSDSTGKEEVTVLLIGSKESTAKIAPYIKSQQYKFILN